MRDKVLGIHILFLADTRVDEVREFAYLNQLFWQLYLAEVNVLEYIALLYFRALSRDADYTLMSLLLKLNSLSKLGSKGERDGLDFDDVLNPRV